MTISKRIAQTAGLLTVLLPLAAGAQQKLEVGKWTGTVTPPNESPIGVTFDVTMKGDTIGITVNAAEHGSFVFEEVKLDAGKLTFHFTPGPRVDCSLDRKDDASFAGKCTDSEGGTAEMLMVPPKKN
jgi:hypothetical protein